MTISTVGRPLSIGFSCSKGPTGMPEPSSMIEIDPSALMLIWTSLWTIVEGEASGPALGGSAFVLQMLKGTSCLPWLDGAVLLKADQRGLEYASATDDFDLGHRFEHVSASPRWRARFPLPDRQQRTSEVPFVAAWRQPVLRLPC